VVTSARQARRLVKRYALTIVDGAERHHDGRYECLVHCECEDHYYRMRDCKHIEAWHWLYDRDRRRRIMFKMLRAIRDFICKADAAVVTVVAACLERQARRRHSRPDPLAALLVHRREDGTLIDATGHVIPPMDDECPHNFFVGRGCTYGCVDDEGQRASRPDLPHRCGDRYRA